jgi:hypothetical protein
MNEALPNRREDSRGRLTEQSVTERIRDPGRAGSERARKL